MLVKNALPVNYCEIDYTNRVVNILKQNLDDNFEIYFFHNLSAQKIDRTNKIKIILHVGNENAFDNREYENANFVFRFYQSDKCDYKKIFPIPIGYNSSGCNEIDFLNIKPILERSNDVFFVGQQNHRNNFIDYAKTSKYKKNINFSEGFRNGLEIYQYYKELNDSKICLAPKGLSPETFRYIEAFASGCVVITTEKLNTWYYLNSPAIFIEKWDENVDLIIKNLLENDLSELQNEGLKYYKNFLSPDATAKYIINTIKN